MRLEKEAKRQGEGVEKWAIEFEVFVKSILLQKGRNPFWVGFSFVRDTLLSRGKIAMRRGKRISFKEKLKINLKPFILFFLGCFFSNFVILRFLLEDPFASSLYYILWSSLAVSLIYLFQLMIKDYPPRK